MPDRGSVSFLEWALPKLGLAWPGFRRVRHLVGKRLGRRMAELHLPDTAAYRAYLEGHPTEWTVLDAFCRIPISRFYRDKSLFDCLGAEVLPVLARESRERGEGCLNCCSLGCASGEEPYSLNLVWRLRVVASFPAVALKILAVDADEELLRRGRAGVYAGSSLKELPEEWRRIAFDRSGGWYALKPEFRTGIDFQRQDIREGVPSGPFDLVLCRNLVFTYFDTIGRRAALNQMLDELRCGGALVIGLKETLPPDEGRVERWNERLPIYRRAVVAAADGDARIADPR